jgi:hypothetical protein
MHKILLLICLGMTALAATAEPYTTTTEAKLFLATVDKGFKATLVNSGGQALAVLPLSSTWCHHWEVKVFDGAGNEYGLTVPPGPAFMASPESFRILKPGQTMSATFKFKDFYRVDRQTDTVVPLQQPRRAQVQYTFQASHDLTTALSRQTSQPTASTSGPPASHPSSQDAIKTWPALFKRASFLLPLKATLEL